MFPLSSILLIASTFFTASLAVPQPQPQPQSRASSGCGKSQFLPGVTQHRFGLKSSGKDRSYAYHLPSGYDKQKKYPVVLGFHGSSSVGVFFEVDTKMSAKYGGDKILIYPNGLGGSWAGPTYHKDSTVQQDIQFVADIIQDAKASFCVDEERVFGVGMSNGGGFIGTLACDPLGSTLFTALASHSGAFYTDVNGPDNGCAPAKKPVPLLEIHGADDKTVKYGGGQGDGGPQPAISDWLEWWAQRNACTEKTEETTHDGKVHHYSWTCDGRRGMLQHYKIDGLGHCWADTELNLSQISVPQLPTVVRASEIVMKFFEGF